MPDPSIFVVMLQISTTDPKLTLANITAAMGSGEARAFVNIRAALLKRLPRDVERVIAVLPVEHAKALMLLHEAVGHELGAEFFTRPPEAYVPPTRD